MDEYLLSAAAELHREDLRREADQERVAARLRRPHALRHQLGESLIRLGRRLTAEPRPRVA